MSRARQLTAQTLIDEIGYCASDSGCDLTDSTVELQSPHAWGNGEQRFPVYAVEYDPDTDTIQIIVEST